MVLAEKRGYMGYRLESIVWQVSFPGREGEAMPEQRPFELEDAIPVILAAFRKGERLFCIKIRGVRSSTAVERALSEAVSERVKTYWPQDKIDTYRRNLRVELHAIERDGNLYDCYRPPII